MYAFGLPEILESRPRGNHSIQTLEKLTQFLCLTDSQPCCCHMIKLFKGKSILCYPLMAPELNEVKFRKINKK